MNGLLLKLKQEAFYYVVNAASKSSNNRTNGHEIVSGPEIGVVSKVHRKPETAGNRLVSHDAGGRQTRELS